MFAIMLYMHPPQGDASYLQMNFAGLQEGPPAGLLSSLPPEQPVVVPLSPNFLRDPVTINLIANVCIH